uniref:Neur_chan_memb domain-containing protein n=1 Tax=Panagrellus redivivus TaxID=6233 RepID=A0A7E4WD24_PANRE
MHIHSRPSSPEIPKGPPTTSAPAGTTHVAPEVGPESIDIARRTARKRVYLAVTVAGGWLLRDSHRVDRPMVTPIVVVIQLEFAFHAGLGQPTLDPFAAVAYPHNNDGTDD